MLCWVEVWAHDRWRIPLPAGHKFPIDKYRLLRERVEDDVTVLESEPVPWEQLAAVHEAPLLERIRTGTMTLREVRGLGLPWSEVLVERGRRSVGGTVAAARRALERGIGMNLGGGTHHAGRDFARGYCLFNDVVVTLAQLRSEGAVRRARRRRLRRPPGRRHRPAARPRPGRLHAVAARRPQLPVRADPVRPRRRPAERHRRRRIPARARRIARHGARRDRPTSPSSWPAPTRGRATASAAWR